MVAVRGPVCEDGEIEKLLDAFVWLTRNSCRLRGWRNKGAWEMTGFGAKIGDHSMMTNRRIAAAGLVATLLIAGVGGAAGCQNATIAVKEKWFGIAKRDQHVARVEDARESQEEAKQRFATALEEFQS